MTKNNSWYISGLNNNGLPVVIKESNKAPLSSIKDTATVFATRDRLPSYAQPKRHPSSVGVAKDQDKNNRKIMTRITIWCQFLKRGIRKDENWITGRCGSYLETFQRCHLYRKCDEQKDLLKP